MDARLPNAALISLVFLICSKLLVFANEVYPCGGYVQSMVDVDLSQVSVQLFTENGNLKHQTGSVEANGYFIVPAYEKGSYVIKLKAPDGWNFEPRTFRVTIDGATDACTKGEHFVFKFTGYSLMGRVLLKGDEKQVIESVVTLFDDNDKAVSTTKTNNGAFTFPAVLPGSYVIRLTDENVCADSSGVKVNLKQSVSLKNSLLVTGFAIHGRVFNEHIGETTLYLFSKDGNQIDCDRTPPDSPVTALAKAVNGFQFACRVKSSKNGAYTFPCIPFGTYVIFPSWQQRFTTLVWSPEFITANVVNSTVNVEEFKAVALSTTGHVFWRPNGKGVNGVQMYLDNEFVTSTNEAGQFLLSNVKFGTHILEAQRSDLEFSKLTLSFNSKMASLPPIMVTKIRQCGKVLITYFPRSDKSRVETKLIFNNQESGETLSTAVDSRGNFCQMLPRGKHIVRPKVEGDGVVLSPEFIEIDVTDKPLEDVTFSQFQATIFGNVHCLDNCSTTRVHLLHDSLKIASTTLKWKNGFVYEFNHVHPANFTIVIDDVLRCWKEQSIQVFLKQENIEDADFRQTGFVVSIFTTHPLTLKYLLTNTKKKVAGEVDLIEGKNSFCLPKAGVYELTTASCYLFDQNILMYNTANPSVLSLRALKRSISFFVNVEKKMTYFEVSIKSNLQTSRTILVAKDAVEQYADESSFYTYKFSYMASVKEILDITVESKDHLVSPDRIHTIASDDCQTLTERFSIVQGLFLTGEILPPLANVDMAIYDGDAHILSVKTDPSGRYSAGPFASLQTIRAEPSMEGYSFKPMANRKHSFTSRQLSKLTVSVKDIDGNPLPDVVVVISGGQDYRIQNLTDNNGIYTVHGVNEGTYYVHAFVKEYSFNPSNQQLTIKEGSSPKITLVGSRIGFSCYGWTKFLSNLPAKDVVVEAVSEDCDNHQEESVTNDQGFYRIRAMQSGCNYTIRPKFDSDNAGYIVWPPSHSVAVHKQDTFNLNFTLCVAANTMDVIGYVESEIDYVTKLTVTIERYGHAEPYYVNRQKMDNSSLFIFTVPKNSGVYVVRLLIPAGMSDFDQQEVIVSSAKALETVRFFYNPPKHRLEIQQSRGSHVAFPILFFLALLIYNYQKVLLFFRSVYNDICGTVGGESQGKKPLNAWNAKFFGAEHLRRRTKAS